MWLQTYSHVAKLSPGIHQRAAPRQTAVPSTLTSLKVAITRNGVFRSSCQPLYCSNSSMIRGPGPSLPFTCISCPGHAQVQVPVNKSGAQRWGLAGCGGGFHHSGHLYYPMCRTRYHGLFKLSRKKRDRRRSTQVYFKKWEKINSLR